tara:strand:- start:1979 stop:2368 length:390 start_codon:yes stop_codon:yes gene_type:complete
MNFLEAVKSYFVRWNDFKGRSSRSEYWWAILFTNIANIVLNMLSTTLQQSESVITLVLLLLILGLLLFMLVAIFSLIARRLHDVNKSGWWYLLVFTIIGMIPLLYWFVQKGDEADNRFGSDPLAEPQKD